MANPLAITVGQPAGHEQNKQTPDIFPRDLYDASAFTLNGFELRERKNNETNLCNCDVHGVSIFIGIMYDEGAKMCLETKGIVNPQLKLYYKISVISALLGFLSLSVLLSTYIRRLN